MFLYDRRVVLDSFHRQEDLRSMDQRSRVLRELFRHPCEGAHGHHRIGYIVALFPLQVIRGRRKQIF